MGRDSSAKTEHAELLQMTLNEEENADELLTELSEQINVAAPAV